MHLLIFVLEQNALLPEILEKLYKVGVTGTTVLNSVGMGRLLVQYGRTSPVGNLIKEKLRKGNYTNKTLFAVIRSEEILDKAIETIDEVVGDLEKPDTGILFTIKLDRVVGLS
jgi:nitrogen regulatory protein PII